MLGFGWYQCLLFLNCLVDRKEKSRKATSDPMHSYSSCQLKYRWYDTVHSLFTISNLQCNVNKSSAPEWPSSLQLFIMPGSPVIPSYWISILYVIFTIEEVSPCKKRSCCCTHGIFLWYSINYSKTGTFCAVLLLHQSFIFAQLMESCSNKSNN